MEVRHALVEERSLFSDVFACQMDHNSNIFSAFELWMCSCLFITISSLILSVQNVLLLLVE